MARIQIEYTANVEALKSKLNELIDINEKLNRSVFSTKTSLENMSKAVSSSTTKKALDDIKKASDEASKSSEAASTRNISNKQKEIDAKRKAELDYVKWWETQLNKIEKAEERKAAQVARIAQREAKQREAAMRATAREAERVERQRVAATERAERQRLAAMRAATRRAEVEERQRVAAAERAERDKVRATERAEAARSRQTANTTKSLMAPLMALRGYAAAAFTISSIVNLGEEIIKLLAKLELLQSRLDFIYGGTSAGSAAFLRVSAAIKNLGLEYEETLGQATAFSIAAQQAGYTTIETEKMFISFASSLRAAGSSSLQVQRSFYALQQMMSKGVVSAEELNRQMGESLPGAAMLMFKAFKNLHPELVQSFEDFRKLQKEGKILSAEVLPEFIRVVEEEFGPALEGKKNSLSARLNRLSQAYTEFKASLLDTEPIKAATSALESLFTKLTAIMSSEQLSPFEKFSAPMGGPAGQHFTLMAELEQAMKLKEAEYLQQKVSEKTLALSKLSKKEQEERYNLLEAEINAYKTYIQLISKTPGGKDFVDRLAIKTPNVAANLKRPSTLAGFDLSKRGYRGIDKFELAVAQQVLRDLGVMISAPGKDTGLDKGGTKGKGEDPRVKAIEDQIAGIRALMIEEQNRMNNYNQGVSFQISTSELLLKLTSSLAEKTKELDLLEAEGKGAEALARAEAEKTVLEEQIKLTNQLIALEIHKLEVEKSIIEERLAGVTSGSIEEYRIREELMNKTAEIEKKKVENNTEAVKKITAQTNAEIKKMYDDLEKRIKQFLSETEEMIAQPFRTEREQEISDINKKFDQQIQSVTEQYQLGTLFSGQKKEGRTPEEGLAFVLKYIDLIDRLNKARQKALSEVDGGESLFGLSDKELENLQKALNVALDLFQDYYAARTEIAKNAIEAEQSLLEKKFEAGLIRENEYNEETKKNKEEMAKLDRDAARFGVLINTAQAIVRLYRDFDAITATILAAGVLAVGATQLSAINSAPMPEFHEGGLDIKKNDRKKPDKGLKHGEFYAKLLEGESVMTREETAKYKDVLKAIRDDSLPLQIMKGYNAPAYHRSMDEPYRMAKEQTSLELAFQNAELVDAIRRNGVVSIKNPDDIADAIVSKSSYTKITNRRRIK